MEYTFKADVGGNTLSIQAGKVAKQASGSVVVQYGDTVVLVTAVSANNERDVDFLPLSVEYQEKIYAAGRIPGNYFRREIGRPSEKETLTARLIDRPIRPLFPKEYRFETQVIATVLVHGPGKRPRYAGHGGRIGSAGNLGHPLCRPHCLRSRGTRRRSIHCQPDPSRIEESDINIIVAGSRTGVVMVEGGGDVVSESDMLEAIFLAMKRFSPSSTFRKTESGNGKAETPLRTPAGKRSSPR
jgi:polyribonucleotide nucleotidyltransferase